MNKIKCFKINDCVLYLEVVLLEFDRVPMLFICRGGNEYYLALCSDLDELEYIVIPAKSYYLVQMLRGKIAMRDMFEKQPNYYLIHSSNIIENDKVEYKKIEDIDKGVLPLSGAKYTIFSEDVEGFTKNMEEALLYGKDSFVSLESKNFFIDSAMPLSRHKDTSLTVTYFKESTKITIEEKRSSSSKFVIGTQNKSYINCSLKDSFETNKINDIELNGESFNKNEYSHRELKMAIVFAA